jgi:hypothetical protein
MVLLTQTACCNARSLFLREAIKKIDLNVSSRSYLVSDRNKRDAAIVGLGKVPSHWQISAAQNV